MYNNNIIIVLRVFVVAYLPHCIASACVCVPTSSGQGINAALVKLCETFILQLRNYPCLQKLSP